MEESEDILINVIILGFICAMIGWLLYEHTGSGDGQIQPVYWAGVATPLLSQIARKVFNLKKKEPK